jgi:shikimate dehydrogenase
VTILASTRLFALLGDPVQHSLSPRMQNAAFAAAGQDAVYVALPCGSRHVASLMSALAAAGGGGNVTVPHKQIAVTALEQATAVVTATGACNTFWLENDQLTGDNTDVAGFTQAALRMLGSLHGIRALVLGAGGGARAAVFALLAEGAERVSVLGRSSASVQALLAHLDANGKRTEAIPQEENTFGMGYDLVVNATPVGMRSSDPSPIDLSRLGHVRAALDLVYSPQGTALVRNAERHGIAALDGAEMLVAQGAASYARWFGGKAPIDVMRAAVATARLHAHA